MADNKMTFHIALCSNPQNRGVEAHNQVGDSEGKSVMQIISEAYLNLKKTIKRYYQSTDAGQTLEQNSTQEDLVYKPATYYLLGTYDAAFITLVDRFKFSQRLIVPVSDDENSDFSNLTSSFQIISGITVTDIISKKNQLSQLFADTQKEMIPPAFLGICNLKLNNSILIGNGNDFFDKVKMIVQNTADDVFGSNQLIFILQSFSWFEVTLLMFTDEVDKISELLFRLRKLKIEQLGDVNQPAQQANLAAASLYRNLPSSFKEQPTDKVLKSHVVIDTHTYIGIHATYVENDQLFKQLLNRSYQRVASEIEWHVKPGHLNGLLQIIECDPELKQSFDVKDISLLVGKSDYLISNKNENSFRDNLKVFRLLIKSNALFDHIRKMKTRIYFRNIDPSSLNTSADQILATGSLGITSFVKELNHLAVSSLTISQINRYLKALKVSRQVRSKVIKTFHNYNNVIQNSVLYTFFLDLGHFVYNLILTIRSYYDNFEKARKGVYILDNESIHEIESNLIDLIDIFQEGYNIRILNCYEYEEITDFDLDFNSSIEQLLTTYNSIAICLGENVYKRDPGGTVYAPIVRLNLKNTVSNYDSINYSVYNFLAPEFIFFTVLKEVLNHFTHNQSGAKSLISDVKDEFYDSIKEHSYLMDFMETDSIDFDYYYIDAIRYIMVCNHDFSLFYYWFWTTNFQNASLYDTIGVMKEKHFKTELFRIMFLARLFNEKMDENQCPIPTLESYWERYYRITNHAIDFLFQKEILITKFRSLIYDEAGECISKFDNLFDAPQRQDNDGFLHTLALNTSKLQYAFKKEYVLKFASGEEKLFNRSIPAYTQYLSNFYSVNRGGIFNGNTPQSSRGETNKGQLYLYAVMHAYLKLLYELNQGKINYLFRSWGDGKPLHSFINVSNPKTLYFIDQTGSIFFIKEEKANQYFTMRNGMLLSLMDFADKYKVHLFADIVERAKKCRNDT